MVHKNLGQVLHDRATRGQVLNASEREQLERWYFEQDQAEAVALDQHNHQTINLNQLQSQIDATLIQIGTMAKRLQLMMSENQSLRQAIMCNKPLNTNIVVNYYRQIP